MKKRLFIFGVCLCVAGRLIAQDVHFMMQHEKTAMKSSVHGSKGIPLKLKTNLLYDALHVPNLSAELGLGKNMSIGLDYWYTWFDSNPTHNYWRSYGGGIGIRRYFGGQSYRQSLTGHHIGIVSQMGMYGCGIWKKRQYVRLFLYAGNRIWLCHSAEFKILSASVSGLAAGIRLSDGAKTTEKVIVSFSMSLTGDMELKGNFRCFGKIPDANISNKLVIYAILKDGSKWCYVYDIINQIDASSDSFKVTVVLDKLPIPNKIENNSGLTAGVSDWNAVDIPIKM